MTPEQRQVTAGIAIQSMVAEIMAGLWSGNMQNDPRLWLAWGWVKVDGEGRQEIADEQERAWRGFRDIEVEGINRCGEAGEEATSLPCFENGFKRARKGT